MYAEGTVLAGKYRIERKLGEGGMGIVLEAYHIHLGIQVALKVLLTDEHDADSIERFLREARASAQLRSENVCRVMDVGILDDGMPYIVMEKLVGRDLQTLLKTEGPLPASTACECIVQASLALAEAHAAGIVHRDLKPGNLFWTQRPDGSRLIKVLDFGVAKTSNASYQLTQNMALVGSPGYMAPEQLRSSNVDVRADIWALGIVLFQLVSGELPFVAESITELAMRIETQPVPPLVGVGPLEAVIARCLQKNPADRYQNVGELSADLATFVGKRGPDLAAAVKRVLTGGGPTAAYTAQIPSQPTTLRGASGVITSAAVAPPKRSLKLPVAFGIAVLAIAATVLVATGQFSQEPTLAAAPAAQPAVQPLAVLVMQPAAQPVVDPPVVEERAVEPAPLPVAAPTPEPVEPPPPPATAAVDEVKPEASTPVVQEPKPVKTASTKKDATTKKPITRVKPVKREIAKKTTKPTPPTPVIPTTTIEEVSESRR